MDNEDPVSSTGQSHHSPELRIVLIGGRELSGKPSQRSETGNTILGKHVFDTNRRTARSIARQHEVHGRQVTVVDTPGWWWHYPRENTPELDQLEIQSSVYLCPPEPHVFLLVIPFGSIFPEIFKKSLEEHLQLFHERVLDHTIVLFSTEAPCSPEKLHSYISTKRVLQSLLQRCGNRTHVLNIKNKLDSAQVRMLFRKIEAMVAENGGSKYYVDRAAGKTQREKMQAIAERATKRFAQVQTQRMKIRTLMTEGGKTPPSHLRLVMIGAQWSAKSSTGNTILGKNAFVVYHGRTTTCCEIGHSVVAQRQLTVVDSPGWLYNQSLQDTCEMDKLEIEYSMCLCPPGPHAVLLVVGLSSAFNSSYQRAFAEHMNLFKDEVWNHAIVLFTRDDWLGEKTIEERIESEKGLQWLVEKCGNRYHVLGNQWLVEKCGNRYHVLDNRKPGDETQVTELLEKVEEMLMANRGAHYEVDLGRAQQLEMKKQAREKIARRNMQRVQRQKGVLRELFRGEAQSLTDMRIVLFGRRESGKSMAGNTILFGELFQTSLMKKEFQVQRRTTTSEKHQRHLAGMDVTVVECPGWVTNAAMDAPDRLQSEVLRSVSMCAPGPHAFLFVISTATTFTKQDKEAIKELLMPFGQRVWKHCMVLFTWGDWLRDRSIEEHIASEGEALRWLVDQCGSRYHVISSHRFGGGFPLIALFQQIIDMVTRNKGHHFTAEEKQKKQQKPVLAWLARKSTLTEEEWNRREEELIERMLKAVALDPEELTLPPARKAASFDGVFVPSMSGGAPSEAGGIYWSHGASAKVSEWLSQWVGSSDITSGFGSMSASTSYVEKMDMLSTIDENLQPKNQFAHKISQLDTFHPAKVSTDGEGTQRRFSF